MSGPVGRTYAAITSLGLSEAFQEKPFQDVTEEDRPTKGTGGALRVIPGSGLVTQPIAESGKGGEGILQVLGTNDREVNPARGRTLVDQEYAAKKADDDVKAIETAKKEEQEFEASPQGDSERRKRAKESSERTGYARRASKQLTTTLSGTGR